jgi:hypothetical protein
MSEKQEVDLYEIPKAELFAMIGKAAEEPALEDGEGKEPNPAGAAVLKNIAKRDASGRFVKNDDVQEEAADDAAQNDADEVEEQEDEPAETVFRRTIDLGDGSGVQVFEAPTLEELVDKLAEAQRNASKKIRELVIKKKEEEKTTADEEFVISQELMSKPTAAFSKLFASIVGMPIETFKTKVERLDAFEKAQAENAASTSFVQKHPEYVANEANGKRMVEYLGTWNLPTTEENLEKAFQALNKIGLVELKSKESNAAKEQTGADKSRIATSEEVVPQQRRRVSSGLSQRGRTVTVPTKPKEPSEDELYSMPKDKLFEISFGGKRS